MSSKPAGEPKYPMRIVMARTALTADVLRAWERRYRAVRPDRTEGGQRLYTATDVERLLLLKRLSDDGHSLGEIARLDLTGLAALAGHAGIGDAPGAHASKADPAIAAALDATAALDGDAIEEALRRAALAHGSRAVIDTIVPAFLREVGRRWHAGAITPAHEHLASVSVRRVLAWTTDAFRAEPHAPRIVVTTASGDQHEFGALLVAAAAAEEGWQVTTLGAGLPAGDAAMAARQLAARAVAVSAVYDTGKAAEHVRALAAALPSSVTLFAGGAALSKRKSSLARARVRVLADLPTLRRALRGLRLAGSGAVAAE